MLIDLSRICHRICPSRAPISAEEQKNKGYEFGLEWSQHRNARRRSLARTHKGTLRRRRRHTHAKADIATKEHIHERWHMWFQECTAKLGQASHATRAGKSPPPGSLALFPREPNGKVTAAAGRKAPAPQMNTALLAPRRQQGAPLAQSPRVRRRRLLNARPARRARTPPPTPTKTEKPDHRDGSQDMHEREPGAPKHC